MIVDRYICCGGIEIDGSVIDTKGGGEIIPDFVPNQTFFWEKTDFETIQMLPAEENSSRSAFRMTGETDGWQTVKVKVRILMSFFLL